MDKLKPLIIIIIKLKILRLLLKQEHWCTVRPLRSGWLLCSHKANWKTQAIRSIHILMALKHPLIYTVAHITLQTHATHTWLYSIHLTATPTPYSRLHQLLTSHTLPPSPFFVEELSLSHTQKTTVLRNEIIIIHICFNDIFVVVIYSGS